MSAGAPERIWRLVQGAVYTQALHVVAELRVADELAGGGLPLDALAERTGADAATLRRFLRALAGEGIFVEQETGTWTNTEASELLRRDGGSWPVAHFFGGPWYGAFGDALHAARTGDETFSRVFGTDWWSWLDDHREESSRIERVLRSGDP